MSDQYEDVFLSLLVHVIGELRQLGEMYQVVREVLFILHVVDICVLDILKEKETHF